MNRLTTCPRTGLMAIDDGSGHLRLLAAFPSTSAQLARLPKWRASGFPTIPRNNWRPISFRSFWSPILDQDGHGSCVGHGAVSAHMKARSLRGLPQTKLSSCCIYGQINGGQDRGAIVSDAADVLLRVGTCLESTVPENHIYESTFPSGWQQEAANYKVADIYHAEGNEEMISGLLYGFIPFYGVMVGNYFGHTDSDGFDTPGGGGGHCMYADGVTITASGRVGVDDQNSWGTGWGKGGYTILGLDDFFRGQNDICLIRVEADELGADLPPDLKMLPGPDDDPFKHWADLCQRLKIDVSHPAAPNAGTSLYWV